MLYTCLVIWEFILDFRAVEVEPCAMQVEAEGGKELIVVSSDEGDGRLQGATPQGDERQASGSKETRTREQDGQEKGSREQDAKRRGAGGQAVGEQWARGEGETKEGARLKDALGQDPRRKDGGGQVTERQRQVARTRRGQVPTPESVKKLAKQERGQPVHVMSSSMEVEEADTNDVQRLKSSPQSSKKHKRKVCEINVLLYPSM